MSEDTGSWRYFVTYSGVKLPLKLVEELTEADLGFRNTYYRSQANDAGLVTKIEKLVRGEIHITHAYSYDDAGKIQKAVIVMDEEESVINF